MVQVLYFFSNLVNILTRKDKIQNRATKQDPGIKEKGNPTTYSSESGGSDIFVCYKSFAFTSTSI